MSPRLPGNTPDVTIIGAGVMGAATAFWLSRLQPALQVLLIEREGSFTTASSSLSASGIRQQFSCAVNIALSRFGIGFLRDAERWLGEDGAGVGLHEAGYLYLANAEQAERLRAVHAIQRREGVAVALLEPPELRERFPWLGTGDIALGSLGLQGEGWFDGPALHRALLRQCARQGVQRIEAEVEAWHCEDGAVRGLRLAGGEPLPVQRLVLAAGAWSGALAGRSGVAVPVEADRRSVFVLSCPEPLPGCPLIVDPSGFWLRPEGKRLITGREPAAESNGLPLDPDWSEFDELQWQRLATRIPALERLRLERAWAGYYEMNRFDHNALLGPWPGLPNLFLITGFSGHGMQQAPGAGLALAEWILEGAPRSIDVRALSPARVARGEPLRELNVIG